MSRTRSGKSLIEMMVVIAVLSVVLTLAGQLLTTMMRAEGRARDSVADRIGLQRLAIQFRDDVRAATSAAEIESEGIALTLPDGKRMEYRIDAEQIRRIVIAANDIVSQEAFQYPQATVRFDISDNEPGTVRLVLIPKIDASTASKNPPRLDGTFEAVATLSRDLRFLTNAQGGE